MLATEELSEPNSSAQIENFITAYDREGTKELSQYLENGARNSGNPVVKSSMINLKS